MRVNRVAVLAMSLSAFASCDGSSTTSVAQTADALEGAQADFCAFRAEADACRTTFDACVAIAGAELTACRTALHDCLPPPPARAEGHCNGGDGGARPPRGGPGRGHPGGPRVHPEPAAVTACREVLSACLAATPDDPACRETERTCVRDAFRSAFDAACADAANICTTIPEEACARLTERCAEGIDGRVDGDGGVCSAPAVIP